MKDLNAYYYKDMPEAGFPVDVAFRVISDPGSITGMHWHEHMQFFYFTEGDAVVYCAGERLAVTAGDLVIINPCDLHDWEARSLPMHCTVIRFDFSFLGCRVQDGCQSKYVEPLENGQIAFRHLVRNDPAVSGCIDALSEEYAARRFGYELAIKGVLFRLMLLLFRDHVSKYLNPREQASRERTNRRLMAVFEYIDRNIGDQLELGTLAGIAGVTPFYFCRIFRAATGTTPVEFINCRRIEKAEALLRETDASITDIAYECGIEDSNYFSRMFRKYRGVSPSHSRSRSIDHS